MLKEDYQKFCPFEPGKSGKEGKKTTKIWIF